MSQDQRDKPYPGPDHGEAANGLIVLISLHATLQGEVPPCQLWRYPALFAHNTR